MSIEAVLLTQLTLVAAKFLFKRYLGEKGQIVGSHGEALHDGGLLGEAGDVVVDVLADLAKDRIKDAIDRMEAVGDIRRYALKVVRQIQSRLDQEAKDNPLIDPKDIAEQLTLTLQADLSTGLLLKHDLESRRLVEAYVSLRPLPQGVLNLDGDLAYERMLDHAVQCLVEWRVNSPTSSRRRWSRVCDGCGSWTTTWRRCFSNWRGSRRPCSVSPRRVIRSGLRLSSDRRWQRTSTTSNCSGSRSRASCVGSN